MHFWKLHLFVLSCEFVHYKGQVTHLSLKTGHIDILKMFHFIFKPFIYAIYNHWHALSVDLQSSWESRTIKNRGLCFSFLCGIAGLGGCDVTGRILKFKLYSQVMLLSWQ